MATSPDCASFEVEMPELDVSTPSMIYKVKGEPPRAYKSRGTRRECELQRAAGVDCAFPCVEGCCSRPTQTGDGRIIDHGFLMDLATPLTPQMLSVSQRRDIMHEMVCVVERLHANRTVHGDIKLNNMLLDDQGKLRLCDFDEGLYLHEYKDEYGDDHVWDGNTTWHFESSNRLLRAKELGFDPPPLTLEDDLYDLGLSIWQLYTGRIPHEDIAGDGLGLKDRQRIGETVDVAEWMIQRVVRLSQGFFFKRELDLAHVVCWPQ